MQVKNCLCLGLFSTFLWTVGCVSVFLVPPVQPLKETTLSGKGKEKIVLIEISGILSEDTEERRPLGSDFPGVLPRLKEELELAAKDPRVKAIVLRINSPGGTVTASDQLHHELAQFKKEHDVPVVAMIMGVGASGGYYVAMAADAVIAHPTGVVGSIGVIMLRLNAEGLLQKLGVETAAIKSGDKKDMGSPFRRMTEEEQQIFQAAIMDYYDRFVEIVAAGRGSLGEEKIRELADGRIYTARQAAAVGLVDELGYLDTAIGRAKQLAGLSEAKVVTYHRPGTYKQNIYSGVITPLPLDALATWNLLRLGVPQFLYLWAPS